MNKNQVKDIIWNVLSEPDGTVSRKKQAKSRNIDIRDKIGDFDRNEYRMILNSMIRSVFFKLVDGNESIEDVNFLKSVEFGTKQWSDKSFNIMKAGNICPNLCLYCYIQPVFHQNNQADVHSFYKRYMDKGVQVIGEGEITGAERRSMLLDFEINMKKVEKGWSKHGNRYLFMTPTSHDIFDSNVKELVIAWKKMIDVGHSILIVTKPSFPCVKYMCSNLGKYKDSVSFRFTITSDNQDVIDIFEPLAPSFEERMACLEYTYDSGFNTSVSIEPFLTCPVSTFEHVLPYITGDAWIGMMNAFPSEKIIGYDFTDRETNAINSLKEQYGFENVQRIVRKLRHEPKVQWKESFINAYLKDRGY